ncbi:glycosyltransferase family 2 protein [uncultured Alistipes sp.]|uniref:glycosyltransferase family 2 protein n=1 Tax=uncultured Alistipes sp. TaxID=538949 RepID=UPI0026205B70|nr:glycosyltransferase family 2 protein [uncultured Alistipes sp.]
MKTEPIISVIVPVYRAEAYIRKCLDSLAAQTFDNFEVILVDDGSPDRCGEICDEYAARDNRFRVIHQNNCGVSVARQIGIDNALGEYTIHVDPDDWVKTCMLSELYNKAQETVADMVICDTFSVDGVSSQFFSPETKEVLLQGILEKKLHGSCCNKLIRNECYRKYDIGFSPQHLCMGEDSLFILRILQHEVKVSYLPKALYFYNTNNVKSLSRRPTLKKLYSGIDFITELEKMNIIGETMDNGFSLKKDVIFDALILKQYSLLPTLYPEIHDVIKRGVHKYNIFSPIAGCLAIALNGKPRLALWIYRVNMVFINTKEYFQHLFRRQV